MATAANTVGTYYLIRQVKPRSRWGDSTSPVYDPNWVVEFRLPGEKGIKESSRLPICKLCMASVDNPAKSRSDCRVANCQSDVIKWADIRLAEKVKDWKEGRTKSAKTPESKRLSLDDVWKVYEQTGPEEKTKNLRALEMATCEIMGKPRSEIYIDELTPDWWDRFAWMYQEQHRRGWLERDGTKPADYLAILRRECPEHPVIDRDEATSANGTIKSVMQKAKSVLGQGSQDNHLKSLRDRFPLTPGFLRWQKTKMKVETVDSRFDLEHGVYEAMWRDLPALKVNDPQAWALIRLHWTTGVRPCEAKFARTTWLEVTAGDAAIVIIVIRNRPEESFRLKDRNTKQARPWPLPADMVEILPSIAISDGSIFGCHNPGQWDKLYRRANKWLRDRGVPGEQTLYNLRKLVATVKVTKEGRDKAAAALGHSNAKTTMQFYAGTSQVITALSDEDLSPEAVLGMRRRPWGMPANTGLDPQSRRI